MLYIKSAATAQSLLNSASSESNSKWFSSSHDLSSSFPYFFSYILESKGRLTEYGRVSVPSYFSGEKTFLKREILLSFLKRDNLWTHSADVLWTRTAQWDPGAGACITSPSPSSAPALPVSWQPQSSSQATSCNETPIRKLGSRHLVSCVLKIFQKFKWVIGSNPVYL